MTKKILVIGATSAIAQEFSRLYAGDHVEFCLVARDQQQLNVIAQDLKVRGAKIAEVLAVDLNLFSAHDRIVQSAFRALTSVDIVLMAHGVLGSQEMADHDPQHVVDLINTNFVSYASLLTLIAHQMKPQRQGTIAVISSVAGDRGKQSNFAYGSAQAGKSAFTDGLRNRLFPHGIHVVTLKLGFVDTPMTADFKKGLLWAKPESVARGIMQAIEKSKNSVYIPYFWRWIMMVITHIPESLFKKLKL